MKVEFKPRRRPDGRYVHEIFRDDQSIGFVHWIESYDGSICTSSRADLTMSPCWNRKQAQAECNWLTAAYARGEIK
jgi:hypothetical protein